MPAREKLSIGPVEAEGPRTTTFVLLLVGAVLGAGFYLGKLSSLMDSCFGLK